MLNAWRRLFIRFLIWQMGFDIAMTKQRLKECKDIIDADERRIHQLKLELISLGESYG